VWVTRAKRLKRAGRFKPAQPAHAGRGFPRGQDGLVIGEEISVAAALCRESHLGVSLALVGLKTERQLADNRDGLGLNFRGRGRNLTGRESIFCGLHPLKKTKPYCGEK
jgi:hypothetical protein